MGPTEAEIVRTLLLGRLPGRLRVAGSDRVLGTPHATDHAGRPLLLILDGSEVATALRTGRGNRNAGPGEGRAASGDDHARSGKDRARCGEDHAGPADDGVEITLAVTDVPPLPDSPWHGRARVAGRARRLTAEEARAVAVEFAAAHPVPELLDVGAGVSIHRVDVHDVRLENDGHHHDVDLAAYAAAAPDPLREDERDLLRDLAEHHAAQIGPYLARAVRAGRAAAGTHPQPVRLDRHGFIVDVPGAAPEHRFLRLFFPEPVRDRHELTELLHPVLFHGAEPRTA